MNAQQSKIAAKALTGGWTSVNDLISCEAGRYRVAHEWEIWSDLAHDSDDTECPVAEPDSVAEFQGQFASGDPWGYIVFQDRSLYFWNNAHDEVWADALDFISENGLCDSEENTQAEMDLLKHFELQPEEV